MTERARSHEWIGELEKGLHLHHHLSPRRERAMLASLGFALALAITRGVTTVLHYRGAGPNGGIVIGGVHIHHLVIGIVGLLLIGYAWLLLYGFEQQPRPRASRLTSLAYGAAPDPGRDRALAQQDVYWQNKDARASRRSPSSPASFSGPYSSPRSRVQPGAIFEALQWPTGRDETESDAAEDLAHSRRSRGE